MKCIYRSERNDRPSLAASAIAFAGVAVLFTAVLATTGAYLVVAAPFPAPAATTSNNVLRNCT